MTGKFKTMLSLLVLGTFVFALSACGSSTNKAITTIEDGQEQMIEISEQLMNGEITNDEANAMMEEISANMESVDDMLKDTYKNVSEFDGLPKWAKNLGLYELKGFEFMKSNSSVTEYNKSNGMGEAISLVYAYDNEAEAILAAEKMAASAGIEESSGHSPRILQKNLDKTMESMMEYMTDEDRAEYEKNKMSGYIADARKGDYYVMISVLEGEISIIATNVEQSGN